MKCPVEIGRRVSARYFLSLIRLLSFRSISALLKIGSVDPTNVYIFDAVSKQALLPATNSLPWPLVFLVENFSMFLVENFSMKHVFAPKRLLAPSQLGQALAQWESKVKWRTFYDHLDEPSSDEFRQLRSKGRTRFCPHELSGDLQQFLNNSIAALYQAGLHGISRARRNSSLYTQPKFVSLAKQVLENHNWHMLPTDKDGGMTIVSDEGLKEATNELISSHDWYRVVKFHDDDFFISSLEDYAMCATSVSVGNPQLRAALLSDMQLPKRCFAATMNFTIKTHKEKGAVVPRPIHSYPRNHMAPGMRWLAQKLSPCLSRVPHLLRDSSDLMTKLKSFKLPEGSRCLKFDVKDFYLTGSHDYLIEQSASILDPSDKEDFSVLAKSILSNQYVHAGPANVLLQVRHGTGMGMIASGHISDAVLYSSLERDLMLKPSVRRRYSISFYARFRDDIIVFSHASLDDLRSLISNMRTATHPFVLKLESVSKTQCQMLDVNVGFRFPAGGGSGHCHFSLFTKPSSIWQPLGPSSMHPLSIHLHWPRAQCKRIRSRYSSELEGEVAANAFKLRYFNLFGVRIDEPMSRPNLPIQATSWIVLPYNFCLVLGGLTRIVTSFVFPDGFSFKRARLSWSLGGKHLIHLLRRHKQ